MHGMKWGLIALLVVSALATVPRNATHAVTAAPVAPAPRVVPVAPALRAATTTALANQDISEPGVCSNCQPPLLPNSGVVMGTGTSPGVITVTPIYWTPDGFNFSSDPGYIPLVNQYITDLAARYHPTKPWRTGDGDRNGSHAAC